MAPISKVESEAPWSYEAGRLNDCHDTNSNLGAIRDAQGYFVAEICPGVENRAGEDCTAANIRLLTNAPGLLAALEVCERQIECLMTWVRDDMPPLTAVCARDNQSRALAVIKRATEGD